MSAEAWPGKVFGFGHEQRRSIARGQPGGEAEVVRVEVGDHHAGDAPPVGRQHLLPDGLCFGRAEAGIHDHHVVAVIEQPQVDVVQRKRQRHAQPGDTGRNRQWLRGGGDVFKRVVEAHGGHFRSVQDWPAW
jgi:hypothetical protein